MAAGSWKESSGGCPETCCEGGGGSSIFKVLRNIARQDQGVFASIVVWIVLFAPANLGKMQSIVQLERLLIRWPHFQKELIRSQSPSLAQYMLQQGPT